MYGLMVSGTFKDMERSLVGAIQSGDTARAIQLLELGTDPNSRWEGCPLLHWALFHGAYEVAEELLRRGSDVSAIDCDQQTALHVCLNENHEESNAMWVRVLVGEGGW